jgi:hypothetical protein
MLHVTKPADGLMLTEHLKRGNTAGCSFQKLAAMSWALRGGKFFQHGEHTSAEADARSRPAATFQGRWQRCLAQKQLQGKCL